MFNEFACGCIVSQFVGRVRVCGTHRPEMATGDGGVANANLRGIVKRYPAHGEMPPEWTGR